MVYAIVKINQSYMQRKWIHPGKKNQVSEDYVQCYKSYNIYYYVKLNNLLFIDISVCNKTIWKVREW